MKRIITVQQRKGGATKTTTAAELVLALDTAGHRVLAIDTDEARGLSVRMGFGAYELPERTTMDFFDGAPLVECVTDSPAIEGAQVLQGGPGLDEVSDLSVTSFRDVLPGAEEWDVAVIDTPGDYGRGTAAAIAAADVVVVPVPAEGEALLALDRMTQWRGEVARRLRRGKSEQQVWYLPTKIAMNQTLDRDLLAVLADRYGDRVTSPVRKVGTTATAAFTLRQPVGLYAPSDGISQDYRAALAPIINGVKGS